MTGIRSRARGHELARPAPPRGTAGPAWPGRCPPGRPAPRDPADAPPGRPAPAWPVRRPTWDGRPHVAGWPGI